MCSPASMTIDGAFSTAIDRDDVGFLEPAGRSGRYRSAERVEVAVVTGTVDAVIPGDPTVGSDTRGCAVVAGGRVVGLKTNVVGGATVVVVMELAVVEVGGAVAVVVVGCGPMLIVTVATEQAPPGLQIEYWNESVPGSSPPVEYLTLIEPWAIT